MTRADKLDREKRKARRAIRLHKLRELERRKQLAPGTEKDSPYYDAVYASSVEYAIPPEESKYLGCWHVALSWIPKAWGILDLGCGTGQFADLAIGSGKNYKLGVDFSQKAIQIAQARLPEYADRFIVRDIRDREVFEMTGFRVAVFLETLEHVHDDMCILSNIPAGKFVILSVPSFSYEGHVRFFRNIQEAEARYSGPLAIIDRRSVNLAKYRSIFLIKGIRR